MAAQDEREKVYRDVEAEHARAKVRAQLFRQPEQPVRVGRFEVRRRVGEGGMGVVFAAWDPELDREVAIKLLPTHDDERANRLLREAKAMARLAHPNVVAIYEAGCEDGLVFLAMEFVPGMDMRAWLGLEPRSWRAITALLIDAAHGLAAAHDAGLVHRDFKPENVLITTDGRAKVADFGLARPAQPGPSSDAEEVTLSMDPQSLETITRTGVVLGTPAYFPPEVLDGGPIDARGDQFSFCVAALEALTGRRPFVSTSFEARRESIHRGDLRPRPGDRPIPGALRRALARGLRPRPEDRHPSMATLVGSLEAVLGRRRRRVLMAGAGIGLASVLAIQLRPEPAAVCTGAGASWAETWSPARAAAMSEAIGRSDHPGAASIAQQVGETLDAYGERWVAAHHDACTATRVRGEQSAQVLDLQMACLEVRRAHVGALVDSLTTPTRAVLDRAVGAARRLPAVDPCRAADTRGWIEPLPSDPQLRERVQDLKAELSRANVLASLGEGDAAQALYVEVQQGADALGYRPLMAQARTSIAQTRPTTLATRDLLYEALFHAEASGYADGARRAWTRLVKMHAYNGEYAEAERAANHALALLDRTGGGPRVRAELLNERAFAQVEQSNFDDAVQLMEEAVRTMETAGEDHPVLGDHLNSLGTIYTLAERNEDALETYERAYALLLASSGDRFSIAHTMMNLGRVHARLDRLGESNAWYQRSLEVFDQLGESQSVTAILARNNLGQNYGDQGAYAEAMATIERAIADMTLKVGDEHRMLVRMRRGLSEVYLDAGETDKEVSECEHALRISEASFGDEHDETASTRRRLGRILLAADEPSRARPLLERALAGHQKPDTPAEHTALSEYWLFRALRDDPDAVLRARRLATDAAPVLEREGHEDLAVELRAWLER